jgi:hypothetical protein
VGSFADRVPADGAAATTALGDTVYQHDDWHRDASVLLDATTNVQTASYTLVLGDAWKIVELNSASAVNLTVPPNSSVAFPVGTTIEVLQYGAGQVTLVAGSGVTLRAPGSRLKTTGQYSSASLRKRATDEWVVAGDLSA